MSNHGTSSITARHNKVRIYPRTNGNLGSVLTRNVPDGKNTAPYLQRVVDATHAAAQRFETLVGRKPNIEVFLHNFDPADPTRDIITSAQHHVPRLNLYLCGISPPDQLIEMATGYTVKVGLEHDLLAPWKKTRRAGKIH